MKPFVAVVTAFIALSTCHGFLFDVKMDCLTSPWTSWAQIPGLGASVRERTILRYDNKGGQRCPIDRDLRQVKVNPKPSTPAPSNGNQQQLVAQHLAQRTQVINTTVHSVVQPFVRRSLNVRPVTSHASNGMAHFRDLLIVLDSSASIGSENYERTKRSLSHLLKTLCPEPDPFGAKYNHAALITYSSSVTEEFDFRAYDNINAIQAAIDNTPYLAEYTCTTKAFEKAFDMFSTNYGMRQNSDIDKEVLILTDGESNCDGDVFTAAANLRTKARVFALHIGEATATGLEEMTNYVSQPINDHLFALEDFKEFDELIQMLQDETRGMKCVPLDLS